MFIYYLTILLIFYLSVNTCLSHNDCPKDAVQSCSHRFSPKSSDYENNCEMKYYTNNASECSSKKIRIANTDLDFGDVSIKTVQLYGQTMFIVTFSNIQWDYLWLRMYENHRLQYLCRDFYLNQSTVPSTVVLNYNCLWLDPSYEGEVATLEYEYGRNNVTSGRKYEFVIPFSEKITTSDFFEFHVFTYVDVSDLPRLNLKFNVAPAELNVSSYEVTVFRKVGDDVLVVKTLSLISEGKDSISYWFDTESEHGLYYFVVTPINGNGDRGSEFSTPEFLIPKRADVLLIGMVGVSGMTGVMFLVLCIWRRQCSQPESSKRSLYRVLLVYTPTNQEHTGVVLALAGLLRDHFGVAVMVDKLDVRQTKSRDPFLWLKSSFTDATHVVFVLSPKLHEPTRNVYTDVDNLAVHLMQEELSKESTDKKFIVLTLPYSPEIPEKFRHIKHYKLMKTINKFLRNFRKRRVFNVDTNRAFTSWCYEELAVAIKRAEQALANTESANKLNKSKLVFSVKDDGEVPCAEPPRQQDSSVPSVQYYYNVQDYCSPHTSGDESDGCDDGHAMNRHVDLHQLEL